MKLRPYHNPKNIDESLVLAGFRFRYADEMGSQNSRCSYWSTIYQRWEVTNMKGQSLFDTYIVRVNQQ